METQTREPVRTRSDASTIWRIDPAHSRIGFAIRHMKFATVHGRFTSFRGTFQINEERLDGAVVEVEIDAASVDTGEPRRDAHLRSADFFDVATYPAITFHGTRLEPVGPSYFDRWLAAGNLTIRGITRAVKLAVEMNDGGPSVWDGGMVELTASTMIRRKDFGIGLNLPLERAGLVIGNDVTISIVVQAIKDRILERPVVT